MTVTFGISNLEENVRSLGVATRAVDASVNAAQAVVDIVDADSGIAATDAATESAISGMCSRAQRRSTVLTATLNSMRLWKKMRRMNPSLRPHIADFWKARGAGRGTPDD